MAAAGSQPLCALIGGYGTRKYPARGRTATSVAATDLLYYFAEITIATPQLTKNLDCLIGGGIILCGNVV